MAPQSQENLIPSARFRLRGSAELCRGQEFFLGYWHPGVTCHAELDIGSETSIQEIRSGNWMMASSRSPRHAGSRGLVHRGTPGTSSLAFRGYILEPPLHSYSSSDSLAAYWSTSRNGIHNGIFASALIDEEGLSLFTDYLGLSPLYYRSWNGGIAFATSGRFLRAIGDHPDLLAWREVIQCGFISADRSLSQEIHRLPAGGRLRATRNGVRLDQWFDFADFPRGLRPVDERAAKRVEDCFQQSVDRCLRLPDLAVTLPLSSGHDSRRILAALVDRKVAFEALTARVFQKGHRDLDARYASEMARDFGFPHTVVEPPHSTQYRRDDARRGALVDSETQMHTWAVRLFDALPERANLVFDGVLGDILGNPGFRLTELYRSPREDIEVIARFCVAEGFDRVLREPLWPGAEALRDDIRGYLRQFDDRPNVAELAFILLRQRRMTALWSQQLLPAGNVAVLPFADLHYVRLLLEYSPADKHKAVFQRRCLEEFWPRFAKYPGNRDVPDDLRPGQPRLESEQTLASLARLREGLSRQDLLANMPRLLTRRAAMQSTLALFSRRVAMQSAWFLIPLMEFVQRARSEDACLGE